MACSEPSTELRGDGTVPDAPVASRDVGVDAHDLDASPDARASDAEPLADAGPDAEVLDTGAPDTGVLPGCAPGRVIQLALGLRTTFAIRSGGELWSWGDRTATGLPYNGSCCQTRPERVRTATAVTIVAAGESHACAIDQDLHLACWGFNRYGQVGTSTAMGNVPEPRQVDDGRWLDVTAGARHTCGIRALDAQLWCWGNNDEGQLGTGEGPGDRSTPVLVEPAQQWTRVSAGGFFTCAIRAGGSLWCWGSNVVGKLGTGDLERQLVPHQVGTSTAWRAVSAGGSHVFARDEAGRWFGWGRNFDGELGLGDDTGRRAPAASDPALDLRVVAASRFHHSCAVSRGEELYCWGANARGQLGTGDDLRRLEPTRIGAGRAWRTVAAGWDHGCATALPDRTLWCWGNGESGALGTGVLDPQLEPVEVCWPE